MTYLIWIFMWLLRAHSAMCNPPAPVNVTLSSSHFIHLLTWAPGPGTPDGVRYRVMINSLSKNLLFWDDVAGCEHVRSPLMCNLTKDFSDVVDTYYYRVYAVLGNQSSNSTKEHRPFKPIEDTHLDPPLATARACNDTLCVDLRPPIGLLQNVYDTFNYALRISSGQGPSDITDIKSLKQVVLAGLVPGREYCVSVRIIDSVERSQRDSPYSHPHCAFTSAATTADMEISVVICMGILMAVCVVLMFHTGYICLKPSLPDVLLSIKHQEDRLPEPECEKHLFSVLVVAPPPGAGRRDSETEDEGSGCCVEVGYETRRGPDADPHNAPSDPNKSYLASSSPGETPSSCPHSPLVPAPLPPDRLPVSASRPPPGSSPGSDRRFSLSAERPAGPVEDLLLGREGSCLEISLLSVTLGGREEVRPMVEEVVGLLESGTPFLTSDTESWAPETVVTQTADEEEESQGYLQRQKTT